MKFDNAQVDAAFEMLATHNPHVHVPGGTAGDGWAGKLATISMAAAEKLIAQKSNLIRRKSAPPPAKPPAPVLNGKAKK